MLPDAVRRLFSRRREPPRPAGGPEEVAILVERRAAAGLPPGLDERTAADLDLPDLFRRLDSTSSAVGQQWLNARLRSPLRDPAALEAFDGLVTALAEPGAPREALRRTLGRLSGSGAYLLPYLLHDPLPERPAAYWLAPLLTATALAAAAATAARGTTALLVFLSVCAVNIVVRLSFRKRIAPVLHSLPALRGLVETGLSLARLEPGLPSTMSSRLAAAAKPLRGLLRTTGWLAIETERTDELSRIGYEYLSFAFLLDVNAYLFSLDLLTRRRERLRELFEAVGEVDGALSTGAFRASLRDWCRPRLVAPGCPLRADGLFHPLLDAPVPNSVSLDGTSLLVTGSNMSGKTTFVKALGVNALLARTLFTCAAREWEAPALDVVSAIGRSESLAEGTSYYLAEVRRVGELVGASEHPGPTLFLLDELFRGTNTLERIAAGKAVLARLARAPNLVAAASHDLELVALLRGAYLPVHFRESLEGGALTFDYRLRPGPSSTRDAIALLAAVSFPPEVVADAQATFEALAARHREP